MRSALALAVVVLGVLAPTAPAATTLNVIPHGQWEPGVPWATTPGMLPADTQAQMYDRLTPLFRNVTDAQLVPSARRQRLLQVRGAGPRERPVADHQRDRRGHRAERRRRQRAHQARRLRRPAHLRRHRCRRDLRRRLRRGQDRNLLLNQARYNGLAAAIDIPGVSAIQLILGLYNFEPTKQIVDEVTARRPSDRAAGPRASSCCATSTPTSPASTPGTRRTSPTTPPFTRADIYALNAVKGQFLGQGGGDEVTNALFLDAAALASSAPSRGDEAFEDLRARNDPEAAITTSASPPTRPVSVPSRSGVVRLVNELQRAAPKLPARPRGRRRAAAVDHAARRSASNILIASGKASTTGPPLFVGGPQIGYIYPGLTEMGLHGPDIHVRGATSAPFPGYMLIGRGADFASTLTSADGDIIDTYAETLCGGRRRKYATRASAATMEKVDAGTITKDGKTAQVTFYRTVHGSVSATRKARGTGETVALSRSARATARTRSTSSSSRSSPTAASTRRTTSSRAASQTPQTFNSFYASRNERRSSPPGCSRAPEGRQPRPAGRRRGQVRVEGLPAQPTHPQVIDPSSGYIVNWNNKPAQGLPGRRHPLRQREAVQRVDSCSTPSSGASPSRRWPRSSTR